MHALFTVDFADFAQCRLAGAVVGAIIGTFIILVLFLGTVIGACIGAGLATWSLELSRGR